MNMPAEVFKSFILYLRSIPKQDRIMAYNVFIMILLTNTDNLASSHYVAQLKDSMEYYRTHEKDLTANLPHPIGQEKLN
jgi:hypothetical protein